ncbi:MAG TPA: JAB domain-containing protein [Candidatus Acidoferrum sp.]|nr:JAB domain-containing protein [Candidatus Acidoferrum sp.]
MTEMLDDPEKVAAYWRQNIPKADWFDPMKEALVVLVLNTRRRIIGHNLVSLGSLDACTMHGTEFNEVYGFPFDWESKETVGGGGIGSRPLRI